MYSLSHVKLIHCRYGVLLETELFWRHSKRFRLNMELSRPRISLIYLRKAMADAAMDEDQLQLARGTQDSSLQAIFGLK